MDVLKCLVFIYVLHLSLVQRFLALGIFLGPCGNPVGALWDWLFGTGVGSSLFVVASGDLMGFSVASGLRGILLYLGVSGI